LDTKDSSSLIISSLVSIFSSFEISFSSGKISFCSVDCSSSVEKSSCCLSSFPEGMSCLGTPMEDSQNSIEDGNS